MKEINTRNITLKDSTETREAKKLKNSKIRAFIAIPIVPLAIAIILLICINSSPKYQNESMFVGLGLCYLLFIVGLIVFFVLLRPYSKLLRQAKRNDRIRYEEKIRYNERKRLELCDNQEISRKAVEETIREEG